MAPKKSDPGTRPNRVRFVLLEADLSDNNFSELTQAITQALRPATTAMPRLVQPTTQLPPALNGNTVDMAEAEGFSGEETGTESESLQVHPTASKPPRMKKKHTVPDFKHDLDMVGSSISLKDFATQHAPKNAAKRYLVAALWMKEYGHKETINIHGIYSCYKTAGWPLGINDWDQPFRSLVRSDKMRRVEAGEYSITHLGEAALQKAGT